MLSNVVNTETYENYFPFPLIKIYNGSANLIPIPFLGDLLNKPSYLNLSLCFVKTTYFVTSTLGT